MEENSIQHVLRKNLQNIPIISRTNIFFLILFSFNFFMFPFFRRFKFQYAKIGMRMDWGRRHCWHHHYVAECLRLLFFSCWRLCFPALACTFSAHLITLMDIANSPLQISTSTTVLAFTCTWIAAICFIMFGCFVLLAFCFANYFPTVWQHGCEMLLVLDVLGDFTQQFFCFMSCVFILL